MQTVRVLFLLLGLAFFGQQLFAQNSSDDLSNRRIENIGSFDSQHLTFTGLLSTFSFSQNIPISFVQSPMDESRSVHLAFMGGTVREFMDGLMKLNPYYAWTVKDGTIAIYPKGQFNDPVLSDLLDVKIANFEIQPRASCVNLGVSLTKSIEIASFLNTRKIRFHPQSIDGFYIQMIGRDYHASFSNMSLREIMNNVIKNNPNARIWSIYRNSYDGSISLVFIAKFEANNYEK
jgi:hypothetical protein